MISTSLWRRRGLAVLLASGLVVSATSLAGSSAFAAPSTDPDVPKDAPATALGAHDAKLLAEAEAKGEPTVTIIVAADRGETAGVAAGLAKLGATIGRRVDQVGYVRARVPTKAVISAAKLPGVAALDLNESIPMPDPHPQAGAKSGKTGTRPAAGPGPDTPAANPFMPTSETGAVSFKQAHPGWDGRGVTIGILDTGVDLDNPALRTTSTGERKIVDWITETDPIFDGDGTWRAMLTSVTGPSFSFAGATWTAPAGTFRINRFAESITAPSEPGGDVNRDGDTTDTFGVLYDPDSHDIRVDANQNLNFTDDPVMRPYREKFDVGHFGTDNPATPERDQMPFVVEFREDVDVTPVGLPGVADFVNIGIVEAEHGSHVAGITAADNMLGNANFDGAAPGAKLVSARACSWGGGCTAAALTDGMVDLVVNRHADVVNESIGGLPALNDGNNARAELYNRLIRDFGVQLFISAGNEGPGTNTVGDPSVATDAVSVAASVSRETWLANYGAVVRKRYALFDFSSRGPREDGGAKPDIAAPGAAISTTPLWQLGGPVPEAGYQLPPGLQMLNGTSMAAPEATGAAALLLSAGKATGRDVTPAALRRAVYSSANWIDGVAANEQGNGLFNVNGAWQLLRGGVTTRGYTSDAPVCTPISDFLATPDRGTGIYNRCAAVEGGQRPGQARSYQVRLTRTSGPARAVTHTLRWLGNDGTFSAPRQVVLPLNRTVSVAVRARPAAGVHSAILRVDDPATSTVDFEVANTVVAAVAPGQPEYAFSTGAAVDRNSYTSYFVTVPPGAAALQVNLSGLAPGSQTRWVAIDPFGVNQESTSSLGCYANFSDPASCNPLSRAYENPLPGVWELEVESRRTSPLLSNTFGLSARIQGVAVDPATVELPAVTPGQPTPVDWTLTNTFGPVTVSGRGGPLGSAASSRPTIADGEAQTFEVSVPEGATRLDVSINNPADLGADLDLFVFRDDELVGQSADGDSDESVSLADPEAGTYQVEVDGFSVPAGSTVYDYRDVFFSAALGTVSAPETAVRLANGASTAISGSVTAQADPVAGRQLLGELTVVTDEGAAVGRSTITIGSAS